MNAINVLYVFVVATLLFHQACIVQLLCHGRRFVNNSSVHYAPHPHC